MRMVDAIHAYIAEGWHLLPLAPGQKVPLEGQGAKHASNDLGRIMGYLNRYPDMNLGLAVGMTGLFAFDVDKRSGGLETLGTLGPDRPMPRTLISRTAQGGFHFIFQHPQGIDMKNAKGKLPGIDIKTGVAYIVLPPSVLVENDKHAAGDYSWHDAEYGPAYPPVWLLDLLRVNETKKERFDSYMKTLDKRMGTGNKGGSPHAALDAMCRQLAALPVDSRRNNYLHWAAMCCFEDGKIPVNEFRRELASAAMASGLDTAEIETTINSAQQGVLNRS